ncbi:MAG: hypothetical protein GY847_09735 [Proteobacteria bacterium]|nr:hypothetical protein [Pseudomonadota bacterium]
MEAGSAQPPAGAGTLGVGHQSSLPEAGSAGSPPELRRALGRRRPGLPAPCQAFGGSHLRPQNGKAERPERTRSGRSGPSQAIC